MDRIEQYRRVYSSFKEQCSRGCQPCSFSAYCRLHGVERTHMKHILKKEYQPIKTLPGYRGMSSPRDHTTEYVRIYDEFKDLCASGKQPGSFSAFYKSKGYEKHRIYQYLHRRELSIMDLPGYVSPSSTRPTAEIPFEEVIFEEAGFLPVADGKMITVTVDNHVAVSFPADTDVDAVARFIRLMGKEACHVWA